MAAETNVALLKWLITKLTPDLGLQSGLRVPEGIQARVIADGQTFYVNTTGRTIEIPLEGKGFGVLSEKEYDNVLTLGHYDAELICGNNMERQ